MEWDERGWLVVAPGKQMWHSVAVAEDEEAADRRRNKRKIIVYRTKTMAIRQICLPIGKIG